NPTLRFDSGYRCGDRMGLQYDSLIGKIIGFADTRQAAIEQVKHAAQQLVCFGVETNLSFLIALLDNSDFSAIKHHVQSIQADALEALSPAMLACLGALYAFGDCPVASVWDTSIERPLSVRILGMHVHALLSKFQDLITVTLNEEEFQFKLNPQDKTISTDGQYLSYQIFRSSDKDVWLWCPFGNFFVEKYYEPLKLDQGTTATSRFVVAHLPGKVLKLHVAPGDIVEADQALISIESMKMEHVFRAPLAGTVNSIKVEENSLVESGELLVELDY
ncbi:MAG: hypothetical protein KDD62_01960, partial [Bdellovibrionales bacterium]|nr:hypothetical protein [Bdellovibrionales bacterium]